MASERMKYMREMMQNQYKMQGIHSKSGKFRPWKMRIASNLSMMMLKPLKGCKYEKIKLGIMKGERITPPQVKSKDVIFYIHGGGLVAGNAKTSRYYGSDLAVESGCVVYTASYRLAPEHKATAAQEDCISAYEALLSLYPNRNIFVLGESGGAYLTVTTCLMAKDKGLKLPTAVAVYSVLMDASGEIDRSKNEETDISLSCHALEQLSINFCPDQKLARHPYVSPKNGDFSDFSPTFMAWDAGEVLEADSLVLKELLEKNGIECAGKGYKDAFHAFPTMGHMLPEAKQVMKETMDFFASHRN